MKDKKSREELEARIAFYQEKGKRVEKSAREYLEQIKKDFECGEMPEADYELERKRVQEILDTAVDMQRNEPHTIH